MSADRKEVRALSLGVGPSPGRWGETSNRGRGEASGETEPSVWGPQKPREEAYQERKAQLAGAADRAREVMRGS